MIISIGMWEHQPSIMVLKKKLNRIRTLTLDSTRWGGTSTFQFFVPKWLKKICYLRLHMWWHEVRYGRGSCSTWTSISYVDGEEMMDLMSYKNLTNPRIFLQTMSRLFTCNVTLGFFYFMFTLGLDNTWRVGNSGFKVDFLSYWGCVHLSL